METASVDLSLKYFIVVLWHVLMIKIKLQLKVKRTVIVYKPRRKYMACIDDRNKTAVES